MLTLTLNELKLSTFYKENRCYPDELNIFDHCGIVHITEKIIKWPMMLTLELTLELSVAS